jgi:dTDP-4-dehydrorhamnose reductase
MVMEDYNCDMSLLKPITVDDIGLKADRPRDTTLNVKLLQSIWGMPVPSVAEGIERVATEQDPFH